MQYGLRNWNIRRVVFAESDCNCGRLCCSGCCLLFSGRSCFLLLCGSSGLIRFFVVVVLLSVGFVVVLSLSTVVLLLSSYDASSLPCALVVSPFSMPFFLFVSEFGEVFSAKSAISSLTVSSVIVPFSSSDLVTFPPSKRCPSCQSAFGTRL